MPCAVLIDLHGDVPVARFQQSHLAAFADALKDRPVTPDKRLQGPSIQHAIAVGKAKNPAVRRYMCEISKDAASSLPLLKLTRQITRY